ncbi:MAG: ABC transporter ATP-binding protein [Candidatus Dormibacteria bacterium]
MLDADFEVSRRHFPVRFGLTVAAGERVAVLGPSGAGKTSALEAIAGLLPLIQGRIALDGRQLSSAADSAGDVAPGHRGVGLLRQDPGLFPHLSVEDNIAYPPQADRESARGTARRLGLGRLLQARPGGLSGGERQRVALARVLQTPARLLCLDEPFSSLDRALALELLELVQAELEGSAMAALLVTHQLEEAQLFGQRLAVLEHGQLLQVAGPRELVLQPASAAVARAVGYRGWLSRPGWLMAVHPDRVRLVAPTQAQLLGEVVRATPAGARVDLLVRCRGDWSGELHCLLDQAIAAGTELGLALPGAPVFPVRPDGAN